MRAFNGLKKFLLGLGLVLGLVQSAAALTGVGTYKGTYSGKYNTVTQQGTTSVPDNGTVTIEVEQNGTVTCTVSSSLGFGTFSAKGKATFGKNLSILCLQQSFPNYLTVDSIIKKEDGLLSGLIMLVPDAKGPQFSGSYTATLSSGTVDHPSQDPLNAATITGLWYDPAYNGTGFNFLVTDGGFFATYYGRTAASGLLWLISTEVPAGNLKTNTPYTMVLGNTTAGSFSQPAFEVANWGQVEVTFSTCTRATATLSGKDGVQKLNLQRLGGVAGIPTC